jgi:hypothetical protein
VFSDVATKNVATGVNEDVFHIIKGVQMGDVDVSNEPCSNKSRRENDLQVLTMSEIRVPPPPIDSGGHGYVWKEKRFAKPSTTRNKASKKKGNINNSLLETQDTEAKPNNVDLQVDEDLLASLNFSTA